VHCGSCGAVLAEPPSLPLAEHRPCPYCGSVRRSVHVQIVETLRVNSHLSVLQERDGDAVGFSESEREGRASSASVEEDGTLRFSIQGTSPQGEEDTPTACRVFLGCLAKRGYPYTDVVAGSEPADCVLVEGPKGLHRQEVQVVRAIASQTIWRTLARHGALQSAVSARQVVAELSSAIATKARNERLPERIRANLVLALDATRLPGVAFDTIVREFRKAECTRISVFGFKAIWLVGPTARLCWRLDVADE
jgi:hypothetical protein